MDTKHRIINYFEHHRHSTVTRAALVLCVTLPTVSRWVRILIESGELPDGTAGYWLCDTDDTHTERTNADEILALANDGIILVCDASPAHTVMPSDVFIMHERGRLENVTAAEFPDEYLQQRCHRYAGVGYDQRADYIEIELPPDDGGEYTYNKLTEPLTLWYAPGREARRVQVVEGVQRYGAQKT